MTKTSRTATITLNGNDLLIDDVISAANGRAISRIAPNARGAMQASVAIRNQLLQDIAPIYGVTTGFGDNCERHVDPAHAAILQEYLILGHLSGQGSYIDQNITRAAILIRANSLTRGQSGIRPEIVDFMLDMLSENLIPRVPELGSVGASGDLVPLAYIAAAIMGTPSISFHGISTSGIGALAERDLAPIVLEPKEGLALINGTAFASAYAAIALDKAKRIAILAEICTALACISISGNKSHYHPFIHQKKGHSGQIVSAENLGAV